MSDRADPVWEHGENIYPGFKCKYCQTTKKGGGATRLKQHLAGRGTNVVACSNVPSDVRDYFRRDIDNIRDKRKARILEVSKKLAAVVGTPEDFEDDDELQAILRAYGEEEEHRTRRRARKLGGSYDEGGVSSQAAGGLRGGTAEGEVVWCSRAHETLFPSVPLPPSPSSLGFSAAVIDPAGEGDRMGGPDGIGGVDVGGVPADAWHSRRESGSIKRKATMGVKDSDDLRNEEGLNMASDDSWRISMEIENLTSQLAMKRKQLWYSQEVKKLKVELSLKVKDMECLMKQNEELKSKNENLQNSVVELESQIEAKNRHLLQLEERVKTLELSNAQLEDDHRKLQGVNNAGRR